MRNYVEKYGTDALRARIDDLEDALHMLSEPDEAFVDEFDLSGIEDGLLSPADFRAFTCDNARRLWGESLFANTVIGTA